MRAAVLPSTTSSLPSVAAGAGALRRLSLLRLVSSGVDRARLKTYAPEPASLRSRSLDPSTCKSCGAGTPAGVSLCDKCSSSGPIPTADLGSLPAAAPPPLITPREARRPLFAPGQQFGLRYTIIEEVGSGGMGAVYKARDAETGRTVALKLIRPDVITRVGAISRFKRELALAQTVSHANVYRVHDLGEVEGTAFISMEYVDGQSLDDLIHSMGHLSPRQTVAIGRQICRGLQAIHEKSIVHRDLKPSNIMIDVSGVARLMDFGLAYQTGSEHLTSEGQVLGTMAYLSPEQARGDELGPTSDVFALGLILYEMLTGKRPPGDGKPIPLALRGAIEPCPKPNHFVPEVPKAVDNIVMKCLDRDPAKRFPSAETLESALEAVAAGQTTRIALGPLRRTTGPYAAARSRRWTLVAGAALLASLALLAVPAVRSRVLAALGRAPSPGTGTQVVAVLPLTSGGGGADNEDLAVGIADMLATDLADAGCGSVLPRAETTGHDPRTLDIKKLASDLGLTHVVTGSLQKTAGASRVDLNVFASDGSLPTSFGDVDTDAFSLQRRMADRLITALCVARPRRASAAARAPTTSTEGFVAYSRGLRLLDRRDIPGNVDGAISSLNEAVRRDTSFAAAHAALGEALLAKYQETKSTVYSTQAMAAASQGLSLDADSLPVRLTLGRIYKALGDKDAALQQLQKAVALQPKSYLAHSLLGEALVDKGMWNEALDETRAAIDLRPNYWRSYTSLGFALYRMGKYDQAAEAYTRVTSLQPDNAQGFQMLGATLHASGKPQQALEAYTKAVSIRPDSRSFANIGTLQFEREAFEEAVKAYRRAIELEPGRALLHHNLGDAYERAGQAAKAKEAWNTAIKLGNEDLRLNRSDAYTLGVVAICEVKLGHSDMAVEHAAKAVALAPADNEVRYLQASVLALANRPDDALAALDKAIAGGYGIAQAARDYNFESIRQRAEFQRIVNRGRTQ